MEDFNSGYPGETLEDLLKDYTNGQLVKKTYSLLITAPGTYKVESTIDATIHRLGSSWPIEVDIPLSINFGPTVTVELTRDGDLSVSGTIPQDTEITYTATTDIVKSTDLVPSDWDEESEVAPSYIKNKPFGVIGSQSLVNPLSISESTIGTNLFEVYTDVCFQIGHNVYSTLYELGKEIILSVYGGPTVIGTVVRDNGKYFVRHISGTYLIGDVTYCDRVEVKTILEVYIPERIRSLVYITDFDVWSLNLLIEGELQEIGTDLQELEKALSDNRPILVPYKIDDTSFVGYAVLSGYAEDLLYLKIITDIEEITIETIRGGGGFLQKEIHKHSLHDKQDKLVSGKNIKTINKKSILGEGDLEIETGVNYDLNVKGINHRGFSLESPENTIPAYIMSKKKGFTYVEGDVSFTKDGVAVLLHDATIDRTSNGSGNINDLNYQEVLQYDFGSWFSEEYAGVKIPTFTEWIILCKNLGLHPYIELKSSGSYTQAQITQIVNEVEKSGMKGKVTYISFNNSFLGYVKNADAYARLGLLANPLNSSKISQGKALKLSTNEVFMDAKLSSVTDTLINSCISNGLPLEVWTVNTEDEIKGMPAYVSGVTSDNIVAGRVLYEKSLIYIPPTSNWVPTTGISLDRSSFTLTSFAPITLVATVEPSNSSEEVVWKSSNTAVATVNNGVVTPIAEGECTITATSGDFSASCATVVTFMRFDINTKLTGCQLESDSYSAITGTSWIGEVMPNEGYSLKNATIQVIMGGVDITNTAYSNGIITIEKVTGPVSINIVCVAVPVYSITRNLLGCTSNKDIVSIGEGNPYNEVFTPLEDYRLNEATVIITMGGTDISSMYNNGVLNIPEVTGDLVIKVSAVSIPIYSILRNLVNCSSDKTITSVKDGEPYTETITANEGYTLRGGNIIVTMGGVDISSMLASNGVLNIEAVTGDISISVEAAEVVGPQPVVDLLLTNVTDGKITNIGTGGSTYDATISLPKSSRDSYAVSENGLLLNGHAYANVAYGFKASDTFTIIIKARITQKSSNTYQRVYRTDQDAPSLFYSINSTAIGGKLAGVSGDGFTVHNDLGSVTGTGGALNTCYLSIYNEEGFDESIMHEYKYTSNGTKMEFYVDGVLIASQNAGSLKTSTKVGLGDNNTSQSYYATQIEVSEFKIYNEVV